MDKRVKTGCTGPQASGPARPGEESRPRFVDDSTQEIRELEEEMPFSLRDPCRWLQRERILGICLERWPGCGFRD